MANAKPVHTPKAPVKSGPNLDAIVAAGKAVTDADPQTKADPVAPAEMTELDVLKASIAALEARLNARPEVHGDNTPVLPHGDIVSKLDDGTIKVDH